MWTANSTSKTPSITEDNLNPAEPSLDALKAANFPKPQTPISVIGKKMVIKGEITSSEALHIEGRVEGPVDVGANYLHVGPEANVTSQITARELVVRGTVKGNVTLTDRLDIRSGGSLEGNAVAKRIMIEDGAYFKGSIDMRRAEQKLGSPEPAQAPKSNNPMVSALDWEANKLTPKM